ncbi:GTP-binding protein REM 2 isoform 3-T3 [Pelodytes ibericus]
MTLNKREKLGGLRQHWGSLPLPLQPRRRGSMPLPYKHQLRRAQAVDELDWPSVHSGSSDSVRSSESIPEPGIYKVMLLGDSGVGKTTLAGIFGGVEDTFPHDTEHPEDTYERNLLVDGEKTTLMVYDIWDQVSEEISWMQDSCLQMGDAFLLIFSVTDRSSFQHLPGLLLQLRTARPHRRIPIILVGNKGDLARSREVSMEEGRSLAGMLSCKYTETSAALHHNTQELLEGVVRQIRLRRDEGEHTPQPTTLHPPGRRESLTKRARRLLQGLMGKHRGFFKQRSKSCHDLSVL